MILIGGGVGPMAGVVLHRKIIEQTQTNGTDQDHLEVLHLSRSPIIGDRTEYLEGRNVRDPVAGMLRAFRMAGAAFRSEGCSSVAGIPCNTFHAPAIFNRFEQGLDDEGLPIRVIHMIDETIRFIRDRYPAARRVGLMSTTGTRTSGVYATGLGEHGLIPVEVEESDQAYLHEAIYNVEWGLKAVSPPDGRAVERVHECAQLLVGRGAEVLILGCTELPLAIPEGMFNGVSCLDPMTALARALVAAEAPSKLREDRRRRESGRDAQPRTR